MGSKILPNGAYTPRFQGSRQRKPVNTIAAITKVIPKWDSVVDIGCATGLLPKGLRELGYRAWGVEGTPGIGETDENIYEVDLSKSIPARRAKKLQADWGVCLEVGEHIPAKDFHIFLKNLKKLAREFLIITWADHDARGYGHVNCMSQVAITCEFVLRGWLVDEEKTQEVRKGMRPKYKQRLIVFRNSG